MLVRRPLPFLALALAAGCSGDAELPTRAPLGPAEDSRLVFQAVDAGTGGALTNDRMTVRYLVRRPITLDATGVEQVSSTDPYRIAQPVAEDSLVVEVRLEAASYHRLDTVLAVARGDEAGPFTLRMARRLARAAGGGAPASGGGAPTGGGQPAVSGGAAAPPEAPAGGGAPMDRTALNAGNRAYQAGNWVQAVAAYEGLQLPQGASAADTRDYQQARIRQGIAHLNRSEYAAALDALEEAAGLAIPSGAANLRLAQAQCAVMRVDEGRRTLSNVERLAPQLDARERASALAMVQYVNALCGLGDLDRAQAALDKVRVGNRIIQELQSFVDRAATVSPPTEDLTAAVTDAQKQIDAIRARMRRGGEDAEP